MIVSSSPVVSVMMPSLNRPEPLSIEPLESQTTRRIPEAGAQVTENRAPALQGDNVSDANQTDPNTSSQQNASTTDSFSDEVQQVINQLKARDAEVRAHEQAHLAAAGGLATGGASYVYQTGPDGKRYAVGGEVGIDTSPVAGDPEATMQKAQAIRRAALAPAEPSSQDMRVASAATQMEAQARVELAQQTESEGSDGLATDADASSTPETAQPQGQQPNTIVSSEGANSPSGLIERSDFAVRLQLQTA